MGLSGVEFELFGAGSDGSGFGMLAQDGAILS